MQRIACVSQKGGVGKSTLARDIAVQFAANQWDVRIADMDDRQTTCLVWQAKRVQLAHQPQVHVYGCAAAETALKISGCDLVIFDGKPYSSLDTRKIAEVSDLIVLACGPTTDDLDPQILLAHELVKARVPPEKMLFVLNSLNGELDGIEHQAARSYVTNAGYRMAKFVLKRKQAYGQAHNIGKSISEVTHPSLRAQAVGVVTEIGTLLQEVAIAA